MKKEIKEVAKKINIEYIGIAPVTRYFELEERIRKRNEKYGVSEFEEKELELRVNPKKMFSWAKSIIVCLFPYYTGENTDSNISKYARIPDYHKVVKDKLTIIGEYIKSTKGSKYEVFSDTGVLHDRYLAYLAGLGFFGINTCLINEKYGSYFFIGYIITDLELECDIPQKKQCLNCGKCVKNCPGGALDEEGTLNANRCVSYITQLKEMTEEQSRILDAQKMVYGCDVCQEICPHNKNALKTPIKEFYEKRETILHKKELEKLSNREFKKKYGDFPFSWRGKGAILKNFRNKP